MPYIPKFRRTLLDERSLSTVGKHCISSGELNYCFTVIAHAYLNKIGVSYETMNSVIGALECAKQEFYRRILSPYEDEKIRKEGDI